MNFEQFRKRLAQFLKDNHIKIYSYDQAGDFIEKHGLSSLAGQTTGFCLRAQAGHEPLNAIFYEKSCSRESRTFTVCHELGHILLGHLDGKTKLSIDAQETEANIFAAVLMAQLVFSSFQE